MHILTLHGLDLRSMPDSGAIKNYYACFPHSATVDTRAATAGNARGDGCGRPGDRGERSLFFPRKFFGLRPDLVLTEEASDALQEEQGLLVPRCPPLFGLTWVARHGPCGRAAAHAKWIAWCSRSAPSKVTATPGRGCS